MGGRADRRRPTSRARSASASGRARCSSSSAPSTATDGLERKRAMLETKNADLVVFNDVGRSDIGFDAPDNEVVLVTAAGERAGPEGAQGSGRGRDPRRDRRVAQLIEAVVMAAGEGRRLRPLTERWPKPILPIDGRPVVVTLVHELAAAGCGPIVVVTGHLAEQVESAARAAPVRPAVRPPAARARLGRCGRPCGGDAAVRRHAPPTRSTRAGDLARFAGRRSASRRRDRRPRRVPAAALAARGAGRPTTSTRCPARRRTSSPTSSATRSTAGAQVSAIQVGRTRDLTSPADLVRENFPYLR